MLSVYTKFQNHTINSIKIMKIYVFIFCKAILQIAFQNIHKRNAHNVCSDACKKIGIPFFDRQINIIAKIHVSTLRSCNTIFAKLKET